jgi:hypothetical protein
MLDGSHSTEPSSTNSSCNHFRSDAEDFQGNHYQLFKFNSDSNRKQSGLASHRELLSLGMAATTLVRLLGTSIREIQTIAKTIETSTSELLSAIPDHSTQLALKIFVDNV